jgi:hypothetical protein
MSEHSHTRKVTYRSLNPGEELPNDGRIYRDASGVLLISLCYSPELKKRHDIILTLIAAFDQRRTR